MFNECNTDVKEDLLKARDGELRLELGWLSSDFVQRLKNRGSGGYNVVASYGLIPVSAILIICK